MKRVFSKYGVAWSSAMLAGLASCGCRPGGAGGRSGGSGETNDDRSGGGRIPSCLADGGIDLFAAEGDEVLGISWNNLGAWDASGGYRLRWGTAEGVWSDEALIDCTDFECEFNLTGLDNGVAYSLEVESLSASGGASQVSCTVTATPHVLTFLPDLRVHREKEGVQDFPDIVAGVEGYPLFLAWEDGGAIRLTRSDDLGDTWGTPVVVGSGNGQSRPSLAFRDGIEVAELDAVDEVDMGVELPPLLFVAYVEGSEIMLARAVFPDGVEGAPVFETPLSLAAGADPDVTIGRAAVHVAFENEGRILVVTVEPDTLALGTPVRVDTGSEDAHAPSVAAHQDTGDVFVGYHAHRGSGDFNVYANVSTNGGASYKADDVRIDDDLQGQNQLNISIAVDERTGQILATWEDRRGGANVYFSSSEDNGVTWGANIETGAGLSGDQFTPHAVVDPGRNVYVVFFDTTDGQRPMFSRFNPDKTFDPPLPVSGAAGKAGAVGQHPAVANDRFGTIYATWSENRDSPDLDIYFARAQ